MEKRESTAPGSAIDIQRISDLTEKMDRRAWTTYIDVASSRNVTDMWGHLLVHGSPKACQEFADAAKDAGFELMADGRTWIRR